MHDEDIEVNFDDLLWSFGSFRRLYLWSTDVANSKFGEHFARNSEYLPQKYLTTFIYVNELQNTKYSEYTQNKSF